MDLIDENYVAESLDALYKSKGFVPNTGGPALEEVSLRTYVFGPKPRKCIIDPHKAVGYKRMTDEERWSAAYRARFRRSDAKVVADYFGQKCTAGDLGKPIDVDLAGCSVDALKTDFYDVSEYRQAMREAIK